MLAFCITVDHIGYEKMRQGESSKNALFKIEITFAADEVS